MGFQWRAVGEKEQCDMFVLSHVSFVALALLSHAFVRQKLEQGDCLHPEALSNDVQLTFYTASLRNIFALIQMTALLQLQ